MSGICGIVLTRPGVVDRRELPELVRRMAGTLRHRGPDEEGIKVLGEDPPSPEGPLVGLGHRRLSVIDLATGHQPMPDEDETTWVVYNGEVDNFPRPRRAQDSSGHLFRSRSDTECLVDAYEQCGTALVDRVRGAFALGLWDGRRNLLVLARDRLGQRPIYYLHEPQRGLFAFASRLKALVEIPGFDTTVSAEALDRYLTYQYVPHPLCIFESVRKLPPAHTLLFRPRVGATEVRRYWRPQWCADEESSARELQEELRETLTEATRIRMTSDVPLGAFLSGGLDSSITVALMSRMTSRPVRTFSIGFQERRYDETFYARMVARHCGTQHREEIVRPQALEVLPELTWHYDEPFGDSSAIPTFYLSRVARRHVKVVLGGDGGDEIFGGYPRYAAAWLGAMLDRLPGPLRALRSPKLWSRLPASVEAKTLLRRLQRFMMSAPLPPQGRYLDWIRQFSAVLLARLYTPSMRRAVPPGEGGFLEQYYAELARGDFLHRTMYVDLMTYLACDGLNKVDVASMANGLETRSPFLDHKVVELAGRIPRRLKLRLTPLGLEGKLILKQAFGDMLPGPILRRRKMGFGVPIAAWFRDELRALVGDVLLSRSALERGYFEPKEVRRLVEDHLGGRADHGYRLWTLLMLELWHRRFVDGEDFSL